MTSMFNVGDAVWSVEGRCVHGFWGSRVIAPDDGGVGIPGYVRIRGWCLWDGRPTTVSGYFEESQLARVPEDKCLQVEQAVENFNNRFPRDWYDANYCQCLWDCKNCRGVSVGGGFARAHLYFKDIPTDEQINALHDAIEREYTDWMEAGREFRRLMEKLYGAESMRHSP